MASISLFVFFVLSHLLLLHSVEGGNRNRPNCSSFQCGKFGFMGSPFTNITHSHCGYFTVNCTKTPPTIHLWGNKRVYEVINISYTNTSQSIRIKDSLLSDNLNMKTHKCESLDKTNLTFRSFPPISYVITSPTQTLFKCNHNHTLNITSPKNLKKKMSCKDNHNTYYYSHSNEGSPSSLSTCSIIQLPKREHSDKDTETKLPDKDELFSLLSAEFDLEVHVSHACRGCHHRGGQCGPDKMGNFFVTLQ
jgi:hypothetical protein